MGKKGDGLDKFTAEHIRKTAEKIAAAAAARQAAREAQASSKGNGKK